MEIRPITPEERGEFYRVLSRMLAFPAPTPEQLERGREAFRPERSLAVVDSGRFVATTYSHLFDLTLPGRTTIPAAGVTAVAVLTTHRRRGLLRELMHRQLAECRDRGEAVAVLIASEAVIYGRFGYGQSSFRMDVDVDARYADSLRPVEDGGRVRFVDVDEADKLFPSIYDRHRGSRPGAIERQADWWRAWQANRKPDEEYLVVHEDEQGRADGFARYTVKNRWDRGLPDYELTLTELVTSDVAADAALWRHCLTTDLVRKVTAPNRPVDDPLRWLLANPRAMQVTLLVDFLWTRILDVPKALEARRYDTDTTLVLEVSDAMFEEVSGRYRLEAGPEGARCERTDASPDLSMSVADLGSISLGGVAPSELGAVGRIAERTAGALVRADAAFASRPKPWCVTWF